MCASSPPSDSISKGRKIFVFAGVIVLGFAMFAAPAIYFQMGNSGGYNGANLALLGIIQLVLVAGVLRIGLRLLGLSFSAIGFTAAEWKKDAFLGLATGLFWTLFQFGFLFDATGGASRPDIAGILDMVDGSWANVLWYLPLGILGGGVAEELYNRGFFVTVLEDVLGSTRTATTVAATLSVLFFAAGHLPSGLVDWVDILIPSTLYVLLFLYTRRLTASIVAHAVWNSCAVAGIYLVYG